MRAHLLHSHALAIACQPYASHYRTFRALRVMGYARGESFHAVCALAWAGAL